MDKEQLPNEYEDLYRTVLEFMREAKDDEELELMEDLMTSMISDARLIIAGRNKGKTRAMQVIKEWETKHAAKEEPEESEEPKEEEASGDKPMKVVPEDELPDKVLLKPEHKRMGRHPKYPPRM